MATGFKKIVNDYLGIAQINCTFAVLLIVNSKNLMKKGTVKFFNNSKGFGFIKPSDSDEDIFVHSSGLIDEIRENDEVQFEVEQGKKGLNAVNVEIIS